LFLFPSSLSSSSRFRSFVRSFDAIVLSRARASERARVKEFKSENLSETSSISREWISRGKHNFLKNVSIHALSSLVDVSSIHALSSERTRALVASPNASFVLPRNKVSRSATTTTTTTTTTKKKEGIDEFKRV